MTLDPKAAHLVTTPNTGSSGITIGGGSSTYGDSYGILNMYGGVPNLEILMP